MIFLKLINLITASVKFNNNQVQYTNIINLIMIYLANLNLLDFMTFLYYDIY